MRVSAWRRASVQLAALLLTFGCVMAGGGGCSQNTSTSAAPGSRDDMAMSADRQKAIMAADAVISTGENEIADGQKLQATDPDKSAALIKQGEADKARGEGMKQQAVMMTN